MLEQVRVPFGPERLQREVMVAPYKKEPVRSDALPRYAKASVSSVNNLFNSSGGYNVKGVIAGLEKRRSDLFSLALKAVARAQEARARCDQAENRLEKETNQRLMAERRLRELEKDRLRQLQAVKVEGAKTLKVMLAHGEMKAQLKKAEGRIKEVENDARSLTLALARADQKRVEAEATARAAEEKANKIEALFLGEEAAAHEAAERNLVFGFLVYENRRHEMLGMDRAYRKADNRRRQQADYLKNFRLKQNAKLSSPSEQSPLAESKFTSFNSPKPVDDKHKHRATGQAELKVNPKFIVYGLTITLLLVVVGWALRAAFL